MADPTLSEIMVALATQIETELAGTASPIGPDLHVYPKLEPNPTPPAIDIYPADPFQEAIAFGPGNNEMNFTVRVRTNTPDHEGAQEDLLSMMDPRSDACVAMALLSDRSLSGKVQYLNVEGPTGYGFFVDVGSNDQFLGFTLTAKVTP